MAKHMKKYIRLKGRIKTYLNFIIYLGILLCAVSAAVFLIDYRAGGIVTCFTVFYLAITLTLYFYNKPLVMNELISFATESTSCKAICSAVSSNRYMAIR